MELMEGFMLGVRRISWQEYLHLDENQTRMKKSSVGLLACTALVIANMVGTGIFTSLGFQLAEIPSRPAILLLWLIGGLLALCGALCYAELSAALPRSGGEYNFLGTIYHPAVGVMAGLVSIFAGFAAPVALAAMAFGSYLQGIFPAADPRASSVAIVAIVTLAHLRDLRLSSIFQITFTILKIALVIFLSAALFRATEAPPAPAQAWGSYVLTAPFAVSLMYTFYAYSGWNAAAYILGEVNSPGRVVPRALIAGTILVTALYLALNAAFLHAAPMASLAGQINVAQIAAEIVFGPAGGKIIAAIISLGLVSAISAMVWVGPRVTMVMGEDYPLAFGWLKTRNQAGIPIVAVLAQSALTLLLLLTSVFEKVLIWAQFTLLLCSFLAVLGVIILRHTRPEIPRPFRVPFYPLTPVLFLAIAGFAMIYTTFTRPVESFAGLLLFAAGFLVYAVATRGKNTGKL